MAVQDKRRAWTEVPVSAINASGGLVKCYENHRFFPVFQ